MKFLVLIVAISLSATCCFAKGNVITNVSTKTWPTAEIADHYFLECFTRYDQFGLMDRTGKTEPLPLVYRTIKSDDRGWTAAIVTNPRRTMFVRKLIGPEGQIIPKSNRVEIVNFLAENRAPVRFVTDIRSRVKAQADNKLPYSYCTESGELLATRFDQVSAFRDKIAAVRIGDSVGFVGIDGRFLPNSKRTKCQFKDGVSQGYLPAYVDGLWGYLDTNGNWLVKPMFDCAESFKNDFAQVRIHDATPSQNSLTYIDKNGKLFDKRFYCTQPFEVGYAAVCVRSDEQNAEPLWGLIDKAGQWALEPKYSSIGPLVGATRLIQLKENVGVITSAGKILVPPKYSHIGRFSEGLAAFSGPDSSKVGFIDQDGKIVIPPQFALTGDFSEGYAAVQLEVDGKIGFIDRNGSMAIPPKFEDSHYKFGTTKLSELQFHNGVCMLHRSASSKFWKDGLGYINKTGDWLSPLAITNGNPFITQRTIIRYYPGRLAGK